MKIYGLKSDDKNTSPIWYCRRHRHYHNNNNNNNNNKKKNNNNPFLANTASSCSYRLVSAAWNLSLESCSRIKSIYFCNPEFYSSLYQPSLHLDGSIPSTVL
jgi:hypothetical protein